MHVFTALHLGDHERKKREQAQPGLREEREAQRFPIIASSMPDYLETDGD